jgi:hypothetical protein
MAPRSKKAASCFYLKISIINGLCVLKGMIFGIYTIEKIFRYNGGGTND